MCTKARSTEAFLMEMSEFERGGERPCIYFFLQRIAESSFLPGKKAFIKIAPKQLSNQLNPA